MSSPKPYEALVLDNYPEDILLCPKVLSARRNRDGDRMTLKRFFEDGEFLPGSNLHMVPVLPRVRVVLYLPHLQT